MSNVDKVRLCLSKQVNEELNLWARLTGKTRSAITTKALQLYFDSIKDNVVGSHHEKEAEPLREITKPLPQLPLTNESIAQNTQEAIA